MKTIAILWLGLLLWIPAGSATNDQAQVRVRADEAAVAKAFDSFWKAKGTKGRERAARKVLRLEPSFDQVFQHLRRGKTYSDQVKTGKQVESMVVDGRTHHYAYFVPQSYDPTRSYPVQVSLHGGANRPPPSRSDRWYPKEGEQDGIITVYPAAWNEALWWHYSQIDAINRILKRLQRDYNIDENRIALLGFSDGATGTYYQAFLNTTPWSAFVPCCGSASVLSNPTVGSEGLLYAANLTNKPLYIVNTGHDRFYPLHRVRHFIDLFQRAGGELVFREKPFFGHNLNWWHEEEEHIDEFLAARQRHPYPDRLVWQTDDPKRLGRAHWLVLTELGTVAGETALNDWNVLRIEPSMLVQALGFELDNGAPDRVPDRLQVRDVAESHPAALAGMQPGDVIEQVGATPVTTREQLRQLTSRVSPGGRVQIQVQRGSEEQMLEIAIPDVPQAEAYQQAFLRKGLSGRVELVRSGNRVDMVTSGVQQLVLLISPDTFDLQQPLEVYTNGVRAFSGMVRADPEVLLRWASRDLDRTMLFAAEVTIEVCGKENGDR
jgi:predicted esterase